MITFKHDDFEDELYAGQRYCLVVEEDPFDSFFGNIETVVEIEVVEEAAGSPDEGPDAIDSLITIRLANLHAGAKINQDTQLNHSDIVIENHDAPIPKRNRNVTGEECVYDNWGHTMS